MAYAGLAVRRSHQLFEDAAVRALIAATALVVLILYGREFRSDVLQVLRDERF